MKIYKNPLGYRDKMRINILSRLSDNKELDSQLLLLYMILAMEIDKYSKSWTAKQRHNHIFNLYTLINTLNIDDRAKRDMLTAYKMPNKVKKILEISDTYLHLYDKGVIPRRGSKDYIDPFVAMLVKLRYGISSKGATEQSLVDPIIHFLYASLIYKKDMTLDERNVLTSYMLLRDYGRPSYDAIYDAVRENKSEVFTIQSYRMFVTKYLPERNIKTIKEVKSLNDVSDKQSLYEFWSPYGEKITPIDMILMLGSGKEELPLAMKELLFLYGGSKLLNSVYTNLSLNNYHKFGIALYKFMLDKNVDSRIVTDWDSLYSNTLSVSYADNPLNTPTLNFFYRFIELVYNHRDRLVSLYKRAGHDTKYMKQARDLLNNIWSTALSEISTEGDSKDTDNDFKTDTTKFKNDFIMAGDPLIYTLAKYPDSEIEKEPTEIYDYLKSDYRYETIDKNPKYRHDLRRPLSEYYNEVIDKLSKTYNIESKYLHAYKKVYSHLTGELGKYMFLDTINSIEDDIHEQKNEEKINPSLMLYRDFVYIYSLLIE